MPEGQKAWIPITESVLFLYQDPETSKGLFSEQNGLYGKLTAVSRL